MDCSTQETTAKGELIKAIMAHLRFAAHSQNKPFDEGDVFLSLCFRTMPELEKIATLAGV